MCYSFRTYIYKVRIIDMCMGSIEHRYDQKFKFTKDVLILDAL